MALTKDLLGPDAIIERHRSTKQRAQRARDFLLAVGYLLVSHVLLPLLALIVILQWHKGRVALIALLPVALLVATAWGFEARSEKTKNAWLLPNAIEAFGRTWQLWQTDVYVARLSRHRRIWVLTGAATAASVAMYAAGLLPLAGAIAGWWLYWASKKLARSAPVYQPPYSAERIRTAMYATGIWGKDPKQLPPFRHLRVMQSDAYGDTIWLSLHGKPYQRLMATEQQNALVAGFGVRDAEIKVEHPAELPADAIKIRFLNGHPTAPSQHWAIAEIEAL